MTLKKQFKSFHYSKKKGKIPQWAYKYHTEVKRIKQYYKRLSNKKLRQYGKNLCKGIEDDSKLIKRIDWYID